MIPFNRPSYTGLEDPYVLDSLRGAKMSGDGPFSKLCEGWFESTYSALRAILTPSCTHALEMAAILIDIQPGDEVIMPSYTFVSTANAFVMRGATIVFVDVDPATMNLRPELVEDAITAQTKAIVPVHYAGVACNMDDLMQIANKHGLWVVEDAAQAMGSKQGDKHLGTIGHLGTISFHETKNYTSGGEGGLLLVNDRSLIDRAGIIREKGTNRRAFFEGQVDKYTWVDLGSSYLLSDVQAAYLWGQLQAYTTIMEDRKKTWSQYRAGLLDLVEQGYEIPLDHPSEAQNAHLFFVKTPDEATRSKMIRQLAADGVMAVFHYVPLHSAPAGMRFGRFAGADVHTTRESQRLLRLPLWFGITEEQVSTVIASVHRFALNT